MKFEKPYQFQSKQIWGYGKFPGTKMAFHNDKGVSSPRSHNNSWCVCAWKQSSKLVKQKQNCKEKDTHYHSWRFIHPSILNGEIQQAENQHRHNWTQQYHWQNGCHKHLQTASSSNSRMHTISSSRGGYTKMDHIMGHKACSGKCKIAEIIWSLF